MKASDSGAQLPPTSPGSGGTARSNTRQVPYRDALIMGMIAAAIVLISTIVFTRAWHSLGAMGLCGLYTVVAFVVVSGIAMLMNWIVRNDHQDDKQYPVLD